MKKLTLIIAIVFSGILLQAQEFTVKPYNRIKYSFYSLPEEKDVSYQYFFSNELVTKTNSSGKLIDKFIVDSVIIKRDYRGNSDDRTIYYHSKWLSEKTGQHLKSLFKVTIDEDESFPSINIMEYVYDKDEVTILYYSYYDIAPSETDFLTVKNLINTIP